MTTLTHDDRTQDDFPLHPTFIESDGKPAFVVLPYAEYMALTTRCRPSNDPRIPKDGTIPHEVIEMMVANDWSIIRAWREYLDVTQTEMAARLEIRQPTYRAMEAVDAAPKRTTKQRIAKALGLLYSHIDV